MFLGYLSSSGHNTLLAKNEKRIRSNSSHTKINRFTNHDLLILNQICKSIQKCDLMALILRIFVEKFLIYKKRVKFMN